MLMPKLSRGRLRSDQLHNRPTAIGNVILERMDRRQMKAGRPYLGRGVPLTL